MGKILPIHTFGDPVLREPSRTVAAITPEIRTLIDDLFATMHASQGVGLAAEQVGRTESVCIVEIPESYDREDEEGPRLNPDVPLRLALVNPRLVAASRRTCEMEEGCLSFPDIRGNVKRPWRIVIEHLGLDGRTQTTELQGFLARAVQHEMDHLAGRLFIDRFSHVKKFAVRARLRNLEAETRSRRPSRPVGAT